MKCAVTFGKFNCKILRYKLLLLKIAIAFSVVWVNSTCFIFFMVEMSLSFIYLLLKLLSHTKKILTWVGYTYLCLEVYFVEVLNLKIKVLT